MERGALQRASFPARSETLCCVGLDIGSGRLPVDGRPGNQHRHSTIDYMVSSEWGLPPQFENGIVAEDLLANKYGHSVHFWDLRDRKHVQAIDLGANHQMALELRPAHDPAREYGFLGVVVDTSNLEGSIWTWYREGGQFQIKKTATIAPESADASKLPALLKGFGAVPSARICCCQQLDGARATVHNGNGLLQCRNGFFGLSVADQCEAKRPKSICVVRLCCQHAAELTHRLGIAARLEPNPSDVNAGNRKRVQFAATLGPHQCPSIRP